MELILDTNAVSAYADGKPEIEAALVAAEEIWVPVIAFGEYRFGLLQSRRRAEYEQWIAEHLPGHRILNIDEDTALAYADIRLELQRAGKPIPVNDLWIAALCRQHGYDLLSRDKHFDHVAGLRRIHW